MSWKTISELILPNYPSQRRNLIPEVAVDIHGHWLPGVDDGAKTMEEAVEIILGLEELGFRKIIATPHINKRYFDNNPKDLVRIYYDVVQEMVAYDSKIKLGLAAEYMLDLGFRDHLLGDTLLSLDDHYILVELTWQRDWSLIRSLVFGMNSRGFRPLLAHPERYQYLNYYDYAKLKDMGFAFQLNMLSLSGKYGGKTRHNARRIHREDWYEFVGTDIHSPVQLADLDGVDLEGLYNNRNHFGM